MPNWWTTWAQAVAEALAAKWLADQGNRSEKSPATEQANSTVERLARENEVDASGDYNAELRRTT